MSTIQAPPTKLAASDDPILAVRAFRLAWERKHDAEYKVKAAAVERDLAASAGSPVQRARLDAVEKEKLDTYQRRYAEYVRVPRRCRLARRDRSCNSCLLS